MYDIAIIGAGADGVALLGEAAGWVSPSSAEGISYAFKSAHCMSEALQDGLTGFNARYARNTRKMRLNIVLKNLKSPFMYNPLIRKAILRSGIKSVKVVGPNLHQRIYKNVIFTNSTPKQNR